MVSPSSRSTGGSTGDIHNSVTFRCVVLIYKEGIVVIGLCLRQFCYECGMKHLFVLSWDMVRRVARESVVSE